MLRMLYPLQPNYYINKTTKDGVFSGNEYVAKYLVPEFTQFSEQLSCPNGWPGSDCTFNGFAGPAWGHITMNPSTLAWILSGTWRWASMSTVHWYRAQVGWWVGRCWLLRHGAALRI